MQKFLENCYFYIQIGGFMILEQDFDFFISYSRNIYLTFVKEFTMLLQKYGLNIWIDKKDVFLGDEIMSNLYKTIDKFSEKTLGVIIILDQSYFQKEWCLKELKYIIEHNINFFPILFQMEKHSIPVEYKNLRNYNMATIRNNEDINFAANKVLDVYIKNKILTPNYYCIKNDIFSSLIKSYWYADKTDGTIVIKADNIALFIKIWSDNNKILLDKRHKILINIIHYQLLSYYKNFETNELQLKIICHAVEELIFSFSL